MCLEEQGPSRVSFRGADLGRVNLKNSNLAGCVFADAEMRRIDLTHVNLRGADLTGANLTEANFSYSNLREADLGYAMLLDALFTGADLRDSILRHCDLTFAVLNGVQLSGADLERAHFSQTVIARCRDFHQARGLDMVELLQPSSIDLDTLRHSFWRRPDEIREAFGVDRATANLMRDPAVQP